MKIINGNILDVNDGIIVHQVNCKHVAEAGLAKQISTKYPEWHTFYKNCVGELGGITIYKVSETLCIASLYAQYDFGRDKCYTNYKAFEACLKQLQRYMDLYYVGVELFIPYKIGCGLGGGDWNIINKLLMDNLKDFTLVKYGN